MKSFAVKIIVLVFFCLNHSFINAQLGYFQLRGRLYNADKELLEGVEVLIFHKNKKIASVTTSEKGEFRHKFRLNYKYIVAFTKDGYVTKKYEVDTKVPEKNKSDRFRILNLFMLDIEENADSRSKQGLPVAKIYFDEALNEFTGVKFETKAISGNDSEQIIKQLKSELESCSDQNEMQSRLLAEAEEIIKNSDSIIIAAKDVADSLSAIENQKIIYIIDIAEENSSNIENATNKATSEILAEDFNQLAVNELAFNEQKPVIESNERIRKLKNLQKKTDWDSLNLKRERLLLRKELFKQALAQIEKDKLSAHSSVDSAMIKEREARLFFMQQELMLAEQELERVNNELKLRDLEIKNKNNILISLLIGLVLLLMLLYITFKSYKTKKKNSEVLLQKNKIINQRNEEINTQNNELIQRNEEIRAQKEEIEGQKSEIIASINYAQRIQKALLPISNEISDALYEHFVLYKPCNIVSGDFYWFKKIKNFLVIATADCTGHGVPGAFMSMLGIAFLNEIVTRRSMDSSAEILNRLRNRVKKSLHQHGKFNETNDGMDISLYIINEETLELQFSGAYNPLYIVRKTNQNDSNNRNGELIELKADKQPIAVYLIEKEFTTQQFQLQKNDCLYSFSDGYADQFGGSDGRKYKSRKFKELILANYEQPMDKQREVLENEFNNWKGNHEQIDDVLVMGIRI